MKNEKNNKMVGQLYAMLYTKYTKELVRMSLKTNKSMDNAKDATSDFLLKMAERFGNDMDGAKILTDAYVKGSFKNFLCDLYRKSKPLYFSELSSKRSDDDNESPEYRYDIAGTDDADKLINQKENQTMTKVTFGKMKSEDVDLLKSRFVQEESNISIASQMGLTADNIANKVRRSRIAFVKVFNKLGYERGDF